MDALEFDDDMMGDCLADSNVDITASEGAVLQLLQALGDGAPHAREVDGSVPGHRLTMGGWGGRAPAKI